MEKHSVCNFMFGYYCYFSETKNMHSLLLRVYTFPSQYGIRLDELGYISECTELLGVNDSNFSFNCLPEDLKPVNKNVLCK